MLVLLVEDDEDDFVITRDLLSDVEHTEYTVDWVNNSTDALVKLQLLDPKYDVCLLDYRLGNETGVDILRKATLEGVAVPMILLTQHTDRQIDLSAMQEGASDFLVKSEINSTNLDRAIRYVRSIKQHEQERLELALALDARLHAEAANKSKDDFLAMVSHELRGPLNSVLMWTALLQTPDIAPELMATAISTIEHSVKRQSKILDDLLELTRGLNSLTRLNKQRINLFNVLHDVIATHLPAIADKSLALELEPESGELWLKADPERLQQILSNLITNSIKFTPKHGHIKVTIEQQLKADQPVVVINIMDNGAGISEQLLPLIFDRYLQAPMKPNSTNVGLGLGLTITKHLVELHNGYIVAESPGEGLGAKFTVTLPID
ncbi:MAG: hybrid sensor histidine kinase/response regulator [Methylococcaceae bacterium]